MSTDTNNITNTNEQIKPILDDMQYLVDYIQRLKGLGVRVPEEVMISQLKGLITKYNT